MLPLTPTKLGRYEIVDEIGKGAMGVVYLARDPLLGRLVALETFRIGYSVKDQEMEQFRVRFMREAQSAGILTHPNIVTIHDVVEDGGDGLAFIAMEYVRGTNLKLLLQADQTLSPQFVLDILAQVADALDYAHANRVVHRDIKPANILITAENRVKITDFGIARLDSSNLTQEGQLLGTPNYMAPEQIQGKEVDHRADLFALGVVLYEMLTRRKPFQGENLTVVSHRIVYDAFTPPRQYVEDLPPELERVLARALEKAPAKRYQKARELADDLRQAVAAIESLQAPGLAGDALNQTQNLSATIAVPPVAAPLGPGRPRRPRAGRGWLAGVAPARAARVAGVAFAVALLLGASVLLWLAWTQPATPVDADRTEQEVIGLIQAGHDLLRQGRWEEAARTYGEAERLAPELPGPRRMREAAERKQAELAALVAREAVGARLELAREALKDRRLDEAAVAASAVLLTDAGNAEAREILAQVDQARALRRAAPAARQPKPPAPAPQPTETVAVLAPAAPPAAAPVEPAVGTVQVHFFTELPKGLLRIYQEGSVVADEPFDFIKRTGLLRREPGKGNVTFELKDVPRGQVRFLVYVAPDGGKGRSEQVTASIRGGAQHRLDVHVSAGGKVTATFN
jgi:predicted Ser/Thr protein kinase